jgi:hypothetical protein
MLTKLPPLSEYWTIRGDENPLLSHSVALSHVEDKDPHAEGDKPKDAGYANEKDS